MRLPEHKIFVAVGDVGLSGKSGGHMPMLVSVGPTYALSHATKSKGSTATLNKYTRRQNIMPRLLIRSNEGLKVRNKTKRNEVW